MSTSRSPIMPYKDEDYMDDPGGRIRIYRGQLQVSHTSDTVSWIVDGQQRWVMSKAEFGALVDAYDALTEAM